MTSISALMNNTALRVATRLYRATPLRPVRDAYFRAFLRLVRGRRIIRHIEGMTFELDLGEHIDVCLFLGQYERDVVSLIERFTRPGWVVFDIGANIGAHALRLSKHVGPAGRVYAFEPMEYAFAKLQRNLALSGAANTTAFRIALSDRNAGRQQVAYRSSWPTSGGRKDAASLVDFRRLDDWCREHDVGSVDMIKMDVDGHEMEAVGGGLETIERCRPLFLMETGAWHFASPERNPLQVLASRGYRFWDTTTLQELDLPAIRARLPERDDEMAFSLNLVASVQPLPGAADARWHGR